MEEEGGSGGRESGYKMYKELRKERETYQHGCWPTGRSSSSSSWGYTSGRLGDVSWLRKGGKRIYPHILAALI